MTVPQLGSLPARGEQLLLRVLPHRLQHAEPACFVVQGKERFVDQGAHLIEHGEASRFRRRHHLLSTVEGEAVGEDRQPSQHDALRFAQQVMAPVDERTQRLLPAQSGAGAAGEQREAVVQPRGDCLDRQGAHAGRS